MPPEIAAQTGPPILTWPPLLLAILLHVVILAIVVWDLWAGFGPGSQYSVTAIIQGWVGRMPALAFAAGFSAGHIFWGRVIGGPRSG